MKKDTNIDFELFKNKQIADKSNIGMHITMATFTIVTAFSPYVFFFLLTLAIWLLLTIIKINDRANANKKIERIMEEQSKDKTLKHEESIVMNENPVYYQG